MLFDLFFHPDKGSHQRLDGTRFVAIVESVRDLHGGRQSRSVYAFGDRTAEERLFLSIPFWRTPSRSAANRWETGGSSYPSSRTRPNGSSAPSTRCRGRFVSDKGKPPESRHEPVAVVSVEPALPGIEALDPVAILRLQSGLPAVGEARFNMGADFHFVVGGPGGGTA